NACICGAHRQRARIDCSTHTPAVSLVSSARASAARATGAHPVSRAHMPSACTTGNEHAPACAPRPVRTTSSAHI
ncbi:unnamed protein product, partial [Closterium sp. Naga37s-1]